MSLHRVCVSACAAGLLSAFPAHAQFESLWLIGEDDESQAEFSQENNASNDVLDGDSAILDDDYFFAGTTDAFGVVPEDEPWSSFERAVTQGDPDVRLHFNLTPDQASPATQFQLLVDLIALGGGSSHDLDVLFNGTSVAAEVGITGPTLLDPTFSAAAVGAQAGQNVVTVTRTGGGSTQPWIQFDYIELLANVNTSGCPDPICGFTANPTFVNPGDAVELTFTANPGATLEIDQGVGTVTVNAEGVGSVTVNPTATTTYTLMSNLNGTVDAMEVTVGVDLLQSFAASGFVPAVMPPAGLPAEGLSEVSVPAVARPEQPVTLNWVLADPTATVEIDNGVGDVSAMTNAQGEGSIVLEGALAPTALTTYTLTATRGDETETISVDVDVSSFQLLWQVGVDNGTQAEFSQEAGGENELPGDDFALDDDFYFLGDYTNFQLGFDVTETEPWSQFERAVTSGDPNSRIHFILDSEQAAAAQFMRLTVDLIFLGSANDGAGLHDIEVTFNGQEVYSMPGLDAPTLIEELFTTDVVNAVEGENIVQVTRSGGTAGSWIQFDQISLELAASLECGPGNADYPVCEFTTSTALANPGEEVVLTWVVAPGTTVTLNNGIGDVTGMTSAGGLGSITLTPTSNAVYSITGTLGGDSSTRDVAVDVLLLESFDASGAVALSGPVARPGQPVTLNWVVDPTASVSIEPGIGNVDAQTTDGVGSIEVNPGSETTYTLTATRDADEDSASVVVEVSDWGLLWQVGNDDSSQADFSQENTSNDPPGSEFEQDDDYYVAGDYTAFDAFIGVLDEPEPWVNFDRALTNGDPNNRIHFTMTADQAAPENDIRMQFDMFGLGGGDDPFDHDVVVLFNGNEVLSETGIVAPGLLLETTVKAGDVGAAAGHNVVEVQKVGGAGGWIQFDYTIGEVAAPMAEAGGLRVTAVSFDSLLGGLTVTWTSESGKSYRIETSEDLATWTTAKSGVAGAAGAAETTDVLDLGFDAPPRIYVRVAEE